MAKWKHDILPSTDTRDEMVAFIKSFISFCESIEQPLCGEVCNNFKEEALQLLRKLEELDTTEGDQ